MGQIDISYKGAKIKQYSKLNYLGCVLDECLTGESMAMQVCTKVFIQYRKNRFFSKNLRRLLCNTLIQPNFDYTCAAWYSNLNKKYKTNCRLYKTSVYVSAYNWTAESTSELKILTRLSGFQ